MTAANNLETVISHFGMFCFGLALGLTSFWVGMHYGKESANTDEDWAYNLGKASCYAISSQGGKGNE